MNLSQLTTSRLILLGITIGLLQAQQFEPRCGDCWCIPESNQVCRDYGEGIYDEFSQDMIDTFASFTLAYSSSFLLLEDDNGSSECYPFAESVGPLEGYAESSYPQCVRPETTETSVCAIEYTTLADSPESCPDRRYALATYPSQQEAEAAGAIVTHGGACGVCSNLQDLAMRNKFSDTFESSTVQCSASYAINRDFERLVGCFEDADNFGFSTACARLWAHYSATNTQLCAQACFNTQQLNGDPPECALLECLQCSNSTFQADFNVIGGRTWVKSGITERIARPCADFWRINHDPCQGNTTFEGPGIMPPGPTPAPTTSAGSFRKQLVWIVLTAVAGTIVWR
jgi:hypothetical protein